MDNASSSTSPSHPPRALARCAEGSRWNVVSVHGGQSLQARLAVMGLVPGERLLVVRNRFPGPLILEVKGTRLLLGAGMASRIRVEPCKNP